MAHSSTRDFAVAGAAAAERRARRLRGAAWRLHRLPYHRNGKAFAGGLPFPTPVGTIYSTNITADRANGIGAYSFEDFVRVMRFGVKPDGTRLYPAMPYTAYAKVSDEDLQDLFAYLRQSIAPVSEPSSVGTLAAQQPLAAGLLEHRLP